MPHNDQGGFHKGHRPSRTFEHRLAGGNHRKSDGCLSAFLLIVGLGAAGVYGLVEAVRAIV
jgi:hypothetical protein